MLLAIDTSTKSIGLALHSGMELLAEHHWVTRGFHTVELAPEIALMLRRANRTVADLTAVAVAKGPGSYTGLRIGMALAKGLALAHNLTLLGISTLDIIAKGQPASDAQLFALIQAGRGRISGGKYKWGSHGWEAVGEPANLLWEDVFNQIDQFDQRIIICGEIGESEQAALQELNHVEIPIPAQRVRRPGILAELGWERLRLADIDDPATLAPIYLQTRGIGEA
ncbi:MAG: tRNA (adenosine(37)-N6)-threonylcarbamoyltransferase complex dimerization subunit type 1 TsaB [Anaerolineales bacterium]|nr:tRNA (adenosine(37)-N6)-threonylcarbamoyltransferase complex dimerization subunit type 1 TsaB [Anaerolineales bacterium]